MATLDDKLLGEKLHYYCSSSEDEDEDGSAGQKPTFVAESELKEGTALSSNTGPKGVISDWRRYKQLARENREEKAKELESLAAKLAITCRSDREDEAAKAKAEAVDEELETLLDDEVLHQFIQKRMSEMMAQRSAVTKKKFGQLQILVDANSFLDALDKESKDVIVVVFIFEENAPGCEAMSACFNILCKEYQEVKFCGIAASTAGLSKHFEAEGVPALLVYKGGELVNSFIRLNDVLGDDFFASDLESFLLEHAVLPTKG